MNILRISATSVLLCVSFLTSTFAQELNRFSISGVVKDQTTGRRLAGITVEAINEADTTQRRTTISDATGIYVLDITDIVTDVKDIPVEGIPDGFQLYQNYPNPFNPSTVISYQISEISQVRLVIYNILGQKIKTLVDQRLEPGNYSIVWDAKDEFGRGVSAGLYLYQFLAGEIIETRKMILVDGSVGVGLKRSSSISVVEPQNSNLSKTNAATITLRASGAPIFTFEEKNIEISTQDFHSNISVILKANTKINTDLVVISEPSDSGKVYISALAGTVIDTILGSEKITIVNTQTQEKISNRVDFDGGLLLSKFNASLGDHFSLTLFRESVQLGKSEQIVVESLKPPKVKKSSPTNGDKVIVINTRIFIYFSEPMDTSTVNIFNFMLANGSGNVPGTIGFLHESTVASFTPAIPLSPGTTYTISVTTNVKDLHGLNLGVPFASSFTTASRVADTRIAFFASTTETGGRGSINTMNSDGSDRQRLTTLGSVEDLQPDYSLDGTHIIFNRRIPGGGSDIYIMNWDGTFIENLTNTPNDRDWFPSFSPDGQKIAYRQGSGNRDIFIMDINGLNKVNITNHPAWDTDPDWSPNGQRIVFASNRASEEGDIFVMERDGSNPINLTAEVPGYSWAPAWSPDGKRIAFFNDPDNVVFESIFLMDPDGKNKVELIGGGSGPEDVWVYGSWGKITWSPDGESLAYIENDPEGDTVAIINKDGSNRHRITTPSWETLLLTPDWSPRNP